MLNKFQANNVISKIAVRADTEKNNRWEVTLRVGAEFQSPVGYIIQHETEMLFKVVSYYDQALIKGSQNPIFGSIQKAKAALIPSLIEAAETCVPSICNALFEKRIIFAETEIIVAGVSPFEITLHYVEKGVNAAVKPEILAKNWVLGNIQII